MFKIGQKVRQEFGVQTMEIIGFEEELIENVITQWKDELGTIVTGKFSSSQLHLVTDESLAN
ncbi:hypothetical protein [Flavobacterium sp. 14A]|uniref:hypothetical protein n=1 Tax=Flavobacterium sp. 14A TaxID=2735896 RepID=UPI0015710B84|nr:hypothetical protein [Flavobacterium sp. 14A]NRT10773.1 ribosome recycling factor [Flavobacterium sp. 14A]